ncbi:SdrD B-like domain-containing protein, partial [Finegoldia magna]|uniref:SdrD B-like domain-containing protein n=1 Tax=Finegoldia magna TaxID=1260 RepID=UPI001ED5819C
MDKKNKNNIAKILLAFGVLASPMMLANQVSADNSIANTTNTNNVDATATAQSDAVTTENVIKENKEDKEQAKEVVNSAAENTTTEATKEATTKENTATDETEATSQKEEASEEKEEAVVEDKEAFTLTEAQKQALKQAGFTNAEIEGIEKEIANKLKANSSLDAQTLVDEKISEKTPAEKETNALGISEEPEPEAQQAGETVEDAITNVEIKIGGAKNGDKTEIVNPTALPGRTNDGNTDINLEAQVDFDIPEGTKHGKTFDFVVSDNVNLHGVLKSEEEGRPVVFDGEEIATAEKLTDGRNGYKYTFNEKVDGLKDIRARIIYPLFIDPEKVPMGTKEYKIGEDGKYVLDKDGNPVLIADNKEKVSVTVAGKTASKDYTVEYESEVFDVKSTGPTLSGIADIDQVDDNNYNHTIYVNPTADQLLNGSHVTVQNEKGYNTITFDEDVKNSVKVYKVKDPNKLPLSFSNDFNDGNYEDVTSKANVKLVKDNNNADLNKLVVDVKQGNTNNSMPFDDKDFDSSVYVVTYTGKRTPNMAFKTNTIYTADWRKANGNAKNLSKLGDQTWKWTNEIVIDDAEAIAIANRTYNLGDRVWIDADGDGSQGDSEVGLEGVKVILKGINMSDKETTTDANGNYKFEGLRNGEYTVEFEIPTGYAPTTANKDGVEDKDNSDASQAEGSKVATAIGTINGDHNMNVDFGVIESKVKKGSFKETHVYKTLDFEGNVIEDKTIIEPGKSSEGTKEDSYTSSKIDKAGYELDKVTADKGSDEVTISKDGKEVQPGKYVEEKDLSVTYEYVKRPGRFVEKHIYKTVDKDGKEVSTDYTVINPKKGEPAKEGYSNEKISTAQQPKDGYTFSSETTLESENYVPGKTLEKTYIYTKTKEEPVVETGSFQEHHIYQTVDEDGKLISVDFKNDKDVKTGKVGEEYTTQKIDQPTYELKEVKTENDAASNEDGSLATGKFVKDTIQEVTYIYKRVQPNGSFQEHHKYITKDQDGNIIKTETENGETTKGNTKESYSTSKIEKDDFEFKRIENPIGGPIYSGNGEKTSGNYKSGVKQEITYVYEKTVEVPKEKVGSFQEHHIYRTLREDGTYIVDERVDGDVTSGKSTDSYKTAQVDRKGYTFNEEETTTKNGAVANQNGNYVADTKREVTYVYDRKESPKDIYEMIEETEDFEQELVENKELPKGTIKITKVGKNARYKVLYKHVNPDDVPGFDKNNFKEFAGKYWQEVSREKIAEGQKQIIQYHLGETTTTPTNPEKPLKPNETNIKVKETTKDGVKGRNVTITITNPNDGNKVVKEETFFIPDGKDGQPGKPGEKGDQGEKGKDGQPGTPGQDGKDGKSSSVKVEAGKNDEGKSGHWVITYFDKNG